MRITETEKKHILEAITEISTEQGLTCKEISLFGSRINDDEKGGDLDLYLQFESKIPLDIPENFRKDVA